MAYFLAFEVHSTRIRTALFLLCTVPFLTSNVIRSIAWIPFLGRNGILNGTLMWLGVIDEPVEIFLFSGFSVIISMVHLYTLFMVAPIFNTMTRIDHNLNEAARDAGASEWRVIREIIIPPCSTGIVIGTIFVISLVLGDFMTVRLMSGGQASSVGLAISNMIGGLQYPLAAANAVVLLLVTLLIVGTLLPISGCNGCRCHVGPAVAHSRALCLCQRGQTSAGNCCWRKRINSGQLRLCAVDLAPYIARGDTQHAYPL